MQKYRDQVSNLRDSLEVKIRDDNRTGLKVTNFILAGSWKKHTILRRTTDHPIDIDLVLYVEGDDSINNDLQKLHDFIYEYLKEIYPQKDIFKDIDMEGKTKCIKIKFSGTGLEVDIVPTVPISDPKDYVWQPQRGGGGKYTTSVSKQLDFAGLSRNKNTSYTAIVRAIKWWRNHKELKPTDDEPGLSSFAIELIVAYLDNNYGVETSIEEGIIRFFKFLSTGNFPVISFAGAIKTVPAFDTAVFIADPTNNENNTAKKMTSSKWKEIFKEADEAFEGLNIAQSKNNQGDTIEEWKRVFGPSFNITDEN